MIYFIEKRGPHPDFMGASYADCFPNHAGLSRKQHGSFLLLNGVNNTTPTMGKNMAYSNFRLDGDVWKYHLEAVFPLATKHGDTPVFFIEQKFQTTEEDKYKYLAQRKFLLNFQNGLPAEVGFNGFSVEAALMACLLYMEQWQKTDMKCEENGRAIIHLVHAINWLFCRTARRMAEKTEGKMEEKASEHEKSAAYMPEEGFLYVAAAKAGQEPALVIEAPWVNGKNEQPIVVYLHQPGDGAFVVQRQKGVAEDWRTLHFHAGGIPFTGLLFEAVLAACHARLESFEQLTPFGCYENRCAISHITQALNFINARRARRLLAGLQGKQEEQANA